MALRRRELWAGCGMWAVSLRLWFGVDIWVVAVWVLVWLL
jgi:hypothetical protein